MIEDTEPEQLSLTFSYCLRLFSRRKY